MKRIQRKRTKGWKMPDNALFVGRPTKWGNPYKAESWYVQTDDPVAYPFQYCETVEESIELYKTYIDREIKYKRLNLDELRGKDLACWCRIDSPCHADYLLELINN